jgi:hypothetical protein
MTDCTFCIGEQTLSRHHSVIYMKPFILIFMVCILLYVTIQYCCTLIAVILVICLWDLAVPVRCPTSAEGAGWRDHHYSMRIVPLSPQILKDGFSIEKTLRLKWQLPESWRVYDSLTNMRTTSDTMYLILCTKIVFEDFAVIYFEINYVLLKLVEPSMYFPMVLFSINLSSRSISPKWLLNLGFIILFAPPC